MKIFKIVFLLVIAQTSYCQISSALTYQGLLIDSEGVAIQNKRADFTITISKEIFGVRNIFYQEVNDITTDKNGIFNLIIGEGIPIEGAMADIRWLSFIPDLSISYDLNDGEGEQTIGPTPFNSVPFCFSSKYIICQDGIRGPQGIQGNQGERGLQGPQGVAGQNGTDGLDGVNGLPILPLLDTPPGTPEKGTVYMDNGDNRDDSAPGFRYYDGNGWIDL